jgi:XTP/dITP diphosphohydrolase
MAHSILIASNNAHKLQEFREIFAQFGAGDTNLLTPRMIGVDLDPEENGKTYLENARIKATVFQRAAHRSPLWILADDSGLEVDALGGQPGILSARYHKSAPGNDGCAALVSALQEVPNNQRTARFRAVIVLLSPRGEERAFEGICEGSIGFEKRGTGGFGFDPIFRVAADSQHRHLAEMSASEKHRLSHRGIATQQVIAFLRAMGG